jgi:hypothetical protein
MAASSFSIYAFAALKREPEQIELLEFIFTAPTFVPNEVTDKLNNHPLKLVVVQSHSRRRLQPRLGHFI